VCFLFCTRGCGRIERPAFPAPSALRGQDVPSKNSRARGEIAEPWLLTGSLFEIEVGVHANTLVMPGLDPGIHPSSQEVLPKKMDCRVKPGNDVLTAFARPVGSQ
jgi:hypothetical protein